MPPLIPVVLQGLIAIVSTVATSAMLTAGVLFGAGILIRTITGLFAHTVTTQMTVRQPVSYRRIVHGKVRCAGVLTYAGLSGSDNKYLHLVITLSGHPITSIGSVYFDGNLAQLNTGNYPYYQLETTLGNQTTQPFPLLAAAIPDWNSSCLQQGCAAVHICLQYNTKHYPSGAPSSIAFDVTGKAVYDPRTGATAYSDNSALCVRDWLADTQFGLGASSPAASASFVGLYSGSTAYTAGQIVTDGAGNYYACILASTGNAPTNTTYWAPAMSTIDDAYTIAAANICDEVVAISSGNVATVGGVTHVNVNANQCVLTCTNNLKMGTEVTLSGFTIQSGHDATFLNGLTVTVLVATPTSFTFALTYANYDHDNTGTVTVPTSQAAYTCDGVVDAGQPRGQVLNTLLSSMAGYCVPPGDMWRIYAGAYVTPTLILTQDDLRGPIKMDVLTTKRDLANGIQGTIVCPANNWQQSTYPPYIDTAAFAQDGNQHIWQNLDLPYTTDGIRAQRLAKIHLERIRRQKKLVLSCKLSAFPLQPGDAVMFTFAPLGFNQKIFEVQQAAIVQDSTGQEAFYGVGEENSSISKVPKIPALGIDLVLKEYDSGIFSWNPATDEQTWLAPAVPTTMPSLLTCSPVTGVTVSSGAGTAIVRADGLIQDRLLVQWTSPVDAYVVNGGSIEIYTSPHGAGTWTLAGIADGADTQFYVLNVVDGSSYDVQVYAVNAAGVTSPGVEVDGTVASGGTTNFGGSIASVAASAVATGASLANTAIDSGGVVVAGSIDLSRAYTNKTLDNIADGSSYARLTASAVASSLLKAAHISQQALGLRTTGQTVVSGSVTPFYMNQWYLAATATINVPAGTSSITLIASVGQGGSGTIQGSNIGFAIYSGSAPSSPQVAMGSWTGGALTLSSPTTGTGLTLGLFLMATTGGTGQSVNGTLSQATTTPFAAGSIT